MVPLFERTVLAGLCKSGEVSRLVFLVAAFLLLILIHLVLLTVLEVRLKPCSRQACPFHSIDTWSLPGIQSQFCSFSLSLPL